jgi:hypothetical protein
LEEEMEGEEEEEEGGEGEGGEIEYVEDLAESDEEEDWEVDLEDSADLVSTSSLTTAGSRDLALPPPYSSKKRGISPLASSSGAASASQKKAKRRGTRVEVEYEYDEDNLLESEVDLEVAANTRANSLGGGIQDMMEFNF